jgi:YMGG-like Gly-zipper
LEAEGIFLNDAVDSQRSFEPDESGFFGVSRNIKLDGLARLGGKMRGLLVGAFAATMLTGCAASPERDRNMMIGAGVGAGVGALIGSASGGPPGMWAGAAVGAVSGGVVGSLVRREACYFRNRRGEVWQVPCDNTRIKADACFVGNAPFNASQIPCWRG